MQLKSDVVKNPSDPLDPGTGLEPKKGFVEDDKCYKHDKDLFIGGDYKFPRKRPKRGRAWKMFAEDASFSVTPSSY